MPLIRYTYGPDVRTHGDQPVVVGELEAKVVADDMRRAVRVTEEDLTEMRKADLFEVAADAGVDVKSTDPKAKIVKAVAESEDK